MSTVRIFKHHIHVSYLVLGAVEFFLFAVALYGGVYARFFQNLDEIQMSVGPLFPRAVVFATLMSLGMIAMGLYQPRLREGLTGVYLRILMASASAGVVLTLVFYIFPSLYLGRGALGLSVLLSFLGLIYVRAVFSSLVDEHNFKRRVLILGSGQRALGLEQRLRRRADQRNFFIVGFVHMRAQRDYVRRDKILTLAGNLLDFAITNKVDEIVIAVDNRRRGFPLDDLLNCKLSGVDVVDVQDFFEKETYKIELDVLHPSWLIFSEGFSIGIVRNGSKRLFDLFASIALLSFAWPLMLFTCLAIKIEDGLKAPCLYLQERTGIDGKVFPVMKFRSMIEEAEKDGKAVWARENDDRITRVGQVIRKYRIDELPQLLNVLRGDMAFVGPRPERPEFVEELANSIPYFHERHRVKPGITGWAQLNYPYGATVEDSKQKLQYDLYYAKNHSLFLDIMILLQTVEVILFGKGR